MVRRSIVGNKYLIEQAGGHCELRNGKRIELDNISCPCCGEKMRVFQFDYPDPNERLEDDWYKQDIERNDWDKGHGMSCEKIGLMCESCGAELNVQIKNYTWHNNMSYDITFK